MILLRFRRCQRYSNIYIQAYAVTSVFASNHTQGTESLHFFVPD